MCVEARTPMVGRNPRVSRPIASAWERVGSFTVVTDATAYCATGPYPAQQFMWEWTNPDSYFVCDNAANSNDKPLYIYPYG